MTPVNGIGVGPLAAALTPRAGSAGASPGGTSATGGGRSPSPGSLSSLLQREYTTSVSSVLEDAMRGAFDDPELAAKEQALRGMLLERGAGGAGAAPRPPIAGGGGNGDGTGGANAAPTPGVGTLPEVADAQHQLLELRVAQAESRMGKVSGVVRQRFAAGASLPSAASGQLDIHTFRPRTADEATAFAHRLAIDATEGAAQLDVIASKLELAVADAAAAPTDVAKAAQVQALQQQFDVQKDFVQEIAAVVDGKTGGALTGGTATVEDAREFESVMAVAQREGLGEDEIDTLKKLHGAAMDEVEKPGGSQRLAKATDAFATAVRAFFEAEQRRADQRREHEEQVAERRREEDRAYESRMGEARQAESLVQSWNQQRRAEHENAIARAVARYEEFSATSQENSMQRAS